MSGDRLSVALPFTVLGTGCVVVGGLVAAATSPVPSTHASWAAAYLVLVAGVAQVFLGLGEAVLAPHLPSRPQVVAQAGVWNAGNAAVLTGTLTGTVALVDLGGALLVIGLVLLARTVRGGIRHGTGWERWSLYGFWLLVLVLLVSIPVGLLLARTGAS